MLVVMARASGGSGMFEFKLVVVGLWLWLIKWLLLSKVWMYR